MKALLLSLSSTLFLGFAGIGNAKVHSFTETNFLLDGNTQRFQIRVICPEAFELSSLFVTVRDPDSSSQVKFYNTRALGGIMGPGYLPPYGWNIDHVDFGPYNVYRSSTGNEILSQMAVEKPVGIAKGGSFDLFGTRIGGSGNESISIAAIVDTAENSTAACNIAVVDG